MTKRKIICFTIYIFILVILTIMTNNKIIICNIIII